MAQLRSYLEQPDRPDVVPAAALDHLANCAACRARLRMLAAELALPDPDALTCGEFEDLAPAYLASPDLLEAAALRAALRHMATCPHCTAFYRELRGLVQSAASAADPLIATAPAPDLGFLRATTPQRASLWRLDPLGRLLARFSADLIQALQPAQPLAAGLKSQPAPAMLEQLDSGATHADLRVTLQLERSAADTWRLTVTVQVAGLDWPDLAGIVVELERTGQTVRVERTDAFGKLVFGGLDESELDGLELRITPPDPIDGHNAISR